MLIYAKRGVNINDVRPFCAMLTFLNQVGGDWKRVSSHGNNMFYSSNGPFAVYNHMVQKPPCWRANYPLGHPKQKHIKLSCFVLDVPVGSLLSSMAVFVPCDRKLQRAYCRRERNATLTWQRQHWHRKSDPDYSAHHHVVIWRRVVFAKSVY